MLSEAYELGVADALEYAEKIAAESGSEKLKDRVKRYGRAIKTKAGNAYGATKTHLKAHKGKYGAGAAGAAAAGGGYAYYRSHQGKKR